MEMIVVGWLVLELTNSAWLVALVGFYRSAPFLLAGFIGGPLTDRWGRRTVIRSTQSLTLLVYSITTFLVYTNTVEFWHLCALSFLLGASWSLDFPARRSLIPDIVGKEQTTDALLLESTVQGVARMIGPFLAGALIAQFGAAGCFMVMSILSIFALGGVLALSNEPIERSNLGMNESAWLKIKEGFRYVGQQQIILAVVMVTVVMNLLIFPYTSLLPIFARDILDQGPQGLGILGTATGMGAFAGLFLINYLRRWINIGRIFMIGTIGQCIGLAFFAMSTFFPLSWALLFCAGVGQACFAILQSSIVLMAASDDMRSRSMATIVLAIGADPIGKIQIGILAENLGAPNTLGLQAALAAILVGVIAFMVPDSHRTMPEPVQIKTKTSKL